VIESDASCEQAAPGADLEGGRELREETSTFLRHRLALRGGRRKPSSPLGVGCRDEHG